METRRDKNLPFVNYIWVGPPSSDVNKKVTLGEELTGHDIAGPIAMAKINKQNCIYFFCLDKHCDAYQKKLADYDIRVYSLEHFITQSKESTNEDIRDMSYKMEKILVESLRADKELTYEQQTKLSEGDAVGNKVPVRDRVTVKDAFCLYLHAIIPHSLYTLDTNIMPSEDHTALVLPEDKDGYFRIPVLISEGHIADIWAIYSSSSTKNIPMVTFLTYYNCWNEEAREEFNHREYSVQYEQMLGEAIVCTFENIMMRTGKGNPWDAESQKDSTIWEIRELGITKNYFNTHKLNVFDRAIMAIKKYIQVHDWQVESVDFGLFSIGGETITLNNGKEKKVPACVQKQWQMITEWQSSNSPNKVTVKDLFCNIVNLAIEEGKLSENKKGRQQDTKDYLKKFENIKSNDLADEAIICRDTFYTLAYNEKHPTPSSQTPKKK